VIFSAYVPDPTIRTGKSDLASVVLPESESVSAIVTSERSSADIQPLIFPAGVGFRLNLFAPLFGRWWLLIRFSLCNPTADRPTLAYPCPN
jgi:hypothetical protein